MPRAVAARRRSPRGAAVPAPVLACPVTRAAPAEAPAARRAEAWLEPAAAWPAAAAASARVAQQPVVRERAGGEREVRRSAVPPEPGHAEVRVAPPAPRVTAARRASRPRRAARAEAWPARTIPFSPA